FRRRKKEASVERKVKYGDEGEQLRLRRREERREREEERRRRTKERNRKRKKKERRRRRREEKERRKEEKIEKKREKAKEREKRRKEEREEEEEKARILDYTTWKTPDSKERDFCDTNVGRLRVDTYSSIRGSEFILASRKRCD
ncbi:hypothetical protein OS493_031148, partial [Desmophyllum pertusum]